VTGLVSFAVYSDSQCSTLATTGTGGQINAQPSGSVAVGASSALVTFQVAGTYYWQASFAGDTNNAAAKSGCTSETLAVGKATPMVSTTLTPMTTNVDGSVSDLATVSSPVTPTGTVTYAVYTDTNCSILATTGATGQISAQPGTAPVNVSSNSVTFQQGGTYYWQATYNGDGNDNAAQSPCTSETLVVAKASPGIVTSATPSVILQNAISDNATLSGASVHAGGSITWVAYSTANCSDTTPAFTSSAVTVSGNGTYGPVSFTPTNPGTYYWRAFYTGDNSNNLIATKCSDNNETSTVIGIPKSNLAKAALDVTTNPGGTFSPPAPPITANPGDVIEYQLTYTNQGNGPANITSLTDGLPNNTTYQAGTCAGVPSATITGCTLNAPTTQYPNGSVTWTLTNPVVQAGGSFVVTFEVKLAATFTANSTPVSNFASVCTQQEASCTNSPPVIITVNAPPISKFSKGALDVTKGGTTFASTVMASTGDTIEYQLTYMNNGTGPATIMSLTDPVPAHSTFLSCAGGGGTCSASGGTVTWTLGNPTIPAGGQVVVTFEVKLDSVFPVGTTNVTNVALVCTSQENPSCTPTNSTPTNSTPSNPVTVMVPAAPILGVVKSASTTHGNPGDQITYTLAYSNTGNANATGTTITEQIPAGTQFVSCSGNCSPGTTLPNAQSPTIETWSLGTLNASGSGSVTLTVTVLNSVGCTIANTAHIASLDENQGTSIPSNPVTLTSTPGPNPDGAHANGSAYGALVTAISIPVGPLPSVSSTQSGVGSNSQSKSLLSLSVPSILSLGVLNASTTSAVSRTPAEADSTSVGELANVSILGGAVTADAVRGQAEATANGTGSSFSNAGTTVTNLKINGNSITNIFPNEHLNVLGLLGLPIATVTIDEQTGTTSGPPATQLSGGTYAANLTVNALHVHVLAGTADVIIGHAQAHADFPQTPLCTTAGPTQSVSGHAFIAGVATDPNLVQVLSGYVSIPASGGSNSQSLTALNLGAILSGNVAATSTQGTVTSTSSTSTSIASVGDNKKPNSVVSVLGGLITAQVLTSEASSTATATGASSSAAGTQFVNLKVAGVSIAATVAPNTVIPLLGLGYVVLNEQIPEAASPGHTGLTVRAIDVIVTTAGLGLDVGARVIVDEAHSDATFIAP
jgi:uncharacterized repeat protein (TIGR01451 family)